MSMGRTMFCTQEGPLNTISTNRDATQCVVAGRNVFKIFSIEDEEFVEKMSLRVGKINLNLSCTDVVWNPIEDHILASAATNGAVVTWNLQKSSKSKQDHVFTLHKRTVNKVSFHPTDVNLLLSGSLDGTMMLFDLRQKEVASTFHAGTDCVRDVSFSPHHYFTFSATHDSVVDLWDMRRTDKCERQFTAHNGPVFSCDWHPEDKRWIATAGRDKAIKVWDIQYKPHLEHTIQTIASIARIKWRPQRKYHIASCSQVVDFSINIWDVRRPFIPFAAFNEHKDVTTGIAWRHDPHNFLSVSKDCTLYQHLFRDAVRPADSAAPVGLAINIHGDVTHAVSNKLENASAVKGSGNYQSTKAPSFFRRPPSRSELFKSANSQVQVYQNAGVKNSLSMDWFVISAKKYQLTGKLLKDLCEHNAAISEHLERYDVAQTWHMLKILYSADAGQAITRTFTMDSNPDYSQRNNPDKGAGQAAAGQPRRPRHGQQKSRQTGGTKPSASPGSMSGQRDGSPQRPKNSGRQLSNIASGIRQQLTRDGAGSTRARTVRAAGTDRTGPPDNLNGSPPSVNDESEISDMAQDQPNIDCKVELLLSTNALAEQSHLWDSTQMVVDMLHHFAAKGDVQMSVSVLIVLGDRIRPHIDEHTQEHWLMSYIDLLGRFQLWSCTNEIIKLSGHSAVNCLNQQSTTVRTACNRCGKTLLRSGWLCDKCKGITNSCSVCHHTVRGIYAWCQGCSHGGHLQHLQEWFSKYQVCPAACGHMCEFAS
ncbi:PREDICTED: WD repeat-containing protein 24-like [Priapulus caudatus]|uniref:GATOR2 complex protein WDR24 n=1 Tax=Priapulus caudatus TaxID=37621 RepID=A0ABM1DVQ8_PRICU|nr:PREDICTED: WD repeat-containing protein 24-like [Priapulus caudatus]